MFVTTAGVGLLASTGAALALSSEQMIRQAEAACLDRAVADGWNRDTAKVISAEALDADKVQVVFELSKDGVNTARLTCPYSVSQGVGSFGNLPDRSASALPTVDPVHQGRAWWLLLPLGLGLVSWAALRGRNGDPGTTYGTGRALSGTGLYAEANAHDGEVQVREHPDSSAAILRVVRNGDSIHLTGHRHNDWLEVAKGGWVRDPDLRYDRSTARFT
ncbi:MAG: SH3 domain-containing protein [Synechococcaceae cyanobacterium]|nr:SH3 domain-containing protein [Synechococcaceae cyanobacterium]